MANQFSPDEQAHIEKVLKNMHAKDRKHYAAEDVKRFRHALTAELQSSGELGKEKIDRLLARFRAGEL